MTILMSNWRKFIKGMVMGSTNDDAKKKRTPPIKKLMHHCVLQRSETHIQEFNQWKKSIKFKSRVQYIKNQIELFVSGQPVHEGIDFLKSPTTAGFVLNCEEAHVDATEANFLLDYLKDIVLTEPYVMNLKDTKTIMEGKDIFTYNRYYLKPKLKLSEKPMNQQYGNAILELTFKNAKPLKLKAQFNYYSDSKFTEPLSIHKMFEKIVGAYKN